MLEIFLADLPGFFLDPALQADFLDAAEVEYLEVVRISGSLIGRGRQKGAREVVTVAAQIHTLCLDAIQSGTPVWRQMKMLSVLLAAAAARYLFLRNTHFGMNQFGKLARQVVFVQFTVKTIQTTRCC